MKKIRKTNNSKKRFARLSKEKIIKTIFKSIPPFIIFWGGKLLPEKIKKPLRKYISPSLTNTSFFLNLGSIKNFTKILLRRIYPYLPFFVKKIVILLFLGFQKIRKTPTSDDTIISSPITEQPYGGEEIDKVSVILPVYNQADLLEESIKSVLKQSYQNFELIIIDDGSTDNIEPVLKKYYEHPKVRIYRQPNRGLPAALTIGFEKARGEYWTWTSADNIMLPYQLEKQVEFLKKNQDVAMVYCNYRIIDDQGQPLLNSDFRIQNQNPPGSDLIDLPRNTENLNHIEDNFIGPCFMYRAWAGKVLGGYYGDMGSEDYEYWLRMNLLFKIAHIGEKEPLYLYRVHKNTLSERAKELKIAEKVRKLLQFDKERQKFYKEKFVFYILDKTGLFEKRLFNKNSKGWIANRIVYENPDDLDIEKLKNQKNKTVLAIIDPFDFSTIEILDKIKEIKSKPNIFIILYLNKKLSEWEAEESIFQEVDWVVTDNYFNLCLLAKRLKRIFWIKDNSQTLSVVLALANNWQLLKKAGLIKNLPDPEFYFPRKINLLIETKSLDKGGLEQVVYDIAKKIDKERFNVSVVVTEKPGMLSDTLIKEKIPVFCLTKNKPTLYREILKNGKIDIINSHYSCYFINDKPQNIPVIEFIHGTYVSFTPQQKKDFLERDKFIKKYVAVSKNAAQYAEEVLGINPIKITILPNSLNIDRFKKLPKPKILRKDLNLKETDYVFLVPAAYYSPKGHFLILAALKKIKNLYPRIKIICSGAILDRAFYNKCLSIVKKEKLEGQISFLKFTNMIYDLYRLADALLLPSLVEGWSVAVMEGMYFGLPLILSDVGGARDLIQNNDIGIIIPNPYNDVTELNLERLIEISYDENPKNTQALIDAMINFFKNREKWQKAGKLGREKLLQKYTLDKSIKRYESIFTENLK